MAVLEWFEKGNEKYFCEGKSLWLNQPKMALPNLSLGPKALLLTLNSSFLVCKLITINISYIKYIQQKIVVYHHMFEDKKALFWSRLSSPFSFQEWRENCNSTLLRFVTTCKIKPKSSKRRYFTKGSKLLTRGTIRNHLCQWVKDIFIQID